MVLEAVGGYRGRVDARLRCTQVRKGVYQVQWRPEAAGTYQVSLFSHGNAVAGSPHTVTVAGA